jgi:hypothetical protein
MALHTGQRSPKNRRTDAARESDAIAKKQREPSQLDRIMPNGALPDPALRHPALPDLA